MVHKHKISTLVLPNVVKIASLLARVSKFGGEAELTWPVDQDCSGSAHG